MTLRSRHLVPLIFIVFTAGIGGTMILNLWQTTSSKVPATYQRGEFAGQSNPADIRGSYSFADIEKAFAVPVAELARAFGVEQTADPAAFLCKQLEELYTGVENGEVGTDSVRWFVALYRGLPYTPGEDTVLLPSALAVLGQRLSEAELKGLRIAASGPPAPQPAPVSETAAPEPAASQPAAPASDAAATGQTGIEFSTVKTKLQAAVDRALGKQ